MEKYLYRFGYCAPAQWTSDETHGWDDESSYAFFVIAKTPEAALAWGHEVSEAFSHHLYASAGWEGVIPSWRNSNFAHWIEECPASVFAPSELEVLPIVKDREMPNFEGWDTKELRGGSWGSR